MQPTKVSLQHYDWTRTPRTTSPADSPTDPSPLIADAEGEAGDDSEPPDGAAVGLMREHYDHDNRPISIFEYDDGGGSYGADDVEMQRTMRRELQARDARVGSGTSTAVGMRPGRVFELTGHVQPELDGRYLLVEVRHTFMVAGTGSDERYVNDFRCLPEGVRHRPDRATPRPRIAGLLTAEVVGPSGEEIWTDQHGRVKVQFHWDRLGERNDHSSCFLRVQQPWAGAGWGFVFLPRIGMEVTVAFAGGDRDQPVVSGTLYNGVNHPPLTLDDDKTKSTIKTRSTPGAEGYNELTFEDAAGEEQIIVNAQKDYNETVENDHNTVVHSNQSNTVDGNHTNSADGSQSMSAGSTQSFSAGGNQSMSTDADRSVSVTGKQSITVQGGENKTEVTGNHLLTASDKIEISATTHILLKVGGSSIKIDPGVITLTTAGGATTVMDANCVSRSNDGSQMELTADAKMESSTGSQLELTADATLQSNGGSTLKLDGVAQMESSGSSKVKLDGKATITGTSEASLNGPKATLAGAGGSVEAAAASVTASGAKVDISGQGAVNIAGALVKIN